MPISNSKQGSRSDGRWRVTSLVVVLLLVTGALFLAFPPQEKINQGLDIQGGLSVVLSAQSTDGEAVSDEDMEKSKAIIEERVNALGASEASVQIQGGDQILVQIPGMSDSQEALDTIGRTGTLEFARLDSFTDADVQERISTGDIYETTTSTDTYVSEGGTSYALGGTDYENMSVESGTYTPMFTGDHIINVTVGKVSDGSAEYAVNITLDSVGTEAFAEASKDLLPTNGQIVIIIDGKVNSAPAVQDEITTGQVQITGGYTLEEAKSLQTVLDSGSLPVSFTYEQSETVGPTLGQGELEAGVLAMLLGLAIVMIYLVAFYKGFGLLTVANMSIFACIYLGALAGLSALGAFSLSLAGIAGIILSIGMAADSSILVIEGFKEELKEGRSLKAASIGGVRRAIRTSLDADVVSIISALSLFFLASSTVKGFGLTLALGIVCDILVMLMFKAPAVRLLAPHAMQRHPGFWGVKYSMELGDVRTDGHNYLEPDEVAAATAELKEKKAEEKARKKTSKESAKEREKIASEKAKERKKAAKEASKEKKAAEKAAAKSAKETEKETSKKACKGSKAADDLLAGAGKKGKDKDDEIVEKVFEEKPGDDDVEPNEGEQAIEETSDAQESEQVVEETAEDEEIVKAGESAHGDVDDDDEVSDKEPTGDDVENEPVDAPGDDQSEPSIDEEEPAEEKDGDEDVPAGDESPIPASDVAKDGEVVEPDTNDNATDAEPEPVPVEEHSTVKAHSAAEISALLASSDKFVPAPKKETVSSVGDGFSYTGPADDGSGGAAWQGSSNNAQDGAPKMNRAQRRAMEKSKRSKKNKN